LAAAALLIAAGAGTYYLWFADPMHSYQAAMGERRAVTLTDGSHLLLDSNTEVAVRYSNNMRALTLTKGRARFDVAHDAARPFAVSAGAETVIAVGTAFDVELRASKVLVTLIHGRVVIKGVSDASDHRGQTGAPVQLSPGQQLIVSTGGRPTIAAADFAVTQAWEAGHLVFRRQPLDDAAEQFSRYMLHPIIVDPSAASFRLSGVFNTGDTKSFVSAVTELYPVEAVTDANGAITLRKSP
jgi:transmembrane sensor